MVVRGETPSPNQAVYNDAGPYTQDAPYYIAAAWAGENISRVPDSYTVGNGSTTVANTVVYRNAELNPATDYSLFVRIDIESDTGGEVILMLMYFHSLPLSAPIKKHAGRTRGMRPKLVHVHTSSSMYSRTEHTQIM